MPSIEIHLQVTGVADECFCGDYGDITVVVAPADVLTVISVGDVAVLSETYSPDQNEQVIIRDIGEVLLSYFTNPAFDFSTSFRDGSIDVAISIVCNDVVPLTYNKTQKVHYSRIKIGHDFTTKYSKFLTRYTKKNTSATRQELVSAFSGIDRVDVAVAYILNGVAKYTKIPLSAVTDCTTMNASLGIVTQLLNTNQALTLSTDDILYYDLYAVQIATDLTETIVDKIQYKNDKRYFPHEKHFVYYNCFGVLETITFTGLENRSMELGATFGYTNRNYRKIDTTPVVSNKAYSGYIDNATAESIEDLITSDKVCLYADGVIGDEITITDIEMESKDPSNEPLSYSITYRPTKEKHLKFTRAGSSSDNRIFDSTFDYTFD